MTEATNNASGPVAWQLQLPDGRVTLEKAFPSWAVGGDGYTITPLYTAPPAAAVVMPERLTPEAACTDDANAAQHACDWYNSALDDVARLNPAPAPEQPAKEQDHE